MRVVTEEVLRALRAIGVARAAFHLDGSIASIEFFDREPEPAPGAREAQPETVNTAMPRGFFPPNLSPDDPLLDTAKTK